ncbi:MAG: DUF11 domain-containing protein [Candidatus Kerfeldbacteria bacterium]|nr:DUF11 domain-containing protein [Candidatus Kerfeldbacteria bacterium]
MINFIKPNSDIFRRVVGVVVGMSTVMNVSLTGVLLAPAASLAMGKGAVCPSGNVKYNVGSGYEYTDGSATVNVVDVGDKNQATWQAADGFTITHVCIKIGGQYGGSLKYPDPADGQAGPYDKDISHVVITTESKTDTPPNNPNPPLGQSCGLDISLVIDRSGSFDDLNGEVIPMRNALVNFVDAFTGTPTQVGLVEFSTLASVLQPFTSNLTLVKNGISNEVDQLGSGTTNWEDALQESWSQFDPRPSKPNLIVVATDGSPNTYNTSGGTDFSWTNGLALSRAVAQANAIKSAGTRIVVIGIGQDHTDPDFDPGDPTWNNSKLSAISGPNIAPPAGVTAATDVIKTDFDQLGAAMQEFAKALCGGKILVQKQFDTDGDGQADLDGAQANALLAGWEFDLNGSPSNPANQTTTDTGALDFDVLNGTYSLTETNSTANTVLASAQCVKGTEAAGTVDLGTRTVSGLTMNTDETISCTFMNQATTGTLRVIKQVVGGANVSADWQLSVKQNDQHVANSPQAGNLTGTDYILPPGSYSISESGPANYLMSFSASCANGVAAVGIGQTTVCTVTNTFQEPPPLKPTISLDKQGPATAVPGNNITYTLAWAVSGNAPVTNAFITDPLPSNVTFVSADNGGTLSNGVVTWNLGSKNVGDNGTVSMTVKLVSPLKNGAIINNTGTFDTDQNDPVSDTVTTTVQSTATLAITKANNVTTFAAPGAVVTYTVTVSNTAAATATAENVILTDLLPAGFTFVDGNATTKSFNLGHLAPGASVTTTYTVNVSASQAAGEYTNTAAAKGDNVSPVAAISAVEVRVPQVLAAVTNPDLKITKSIAKDTAKPGDVVTYSLTVENIGDADAVNVVVSDTLPKDLSFVDVKARTRTWKLGTMVAGKRVSFDYDVRVESDAKKGTYKNVAVVTADNVSQRKDDASLKVQVPQVRGLAVTGSGPLDFALFTLGSLLVSLGVVGLRRRQLVPATTAVNFLELV